MEMLTPRDDTKSPSLSIHPATPQEEQAKRAMQQPIGARRITGVRLIQPKGYQPIEALRYVEKQGVLTVGRGNAWAIELTFDKGAKRRRKDLRPDLPLIIRY